MYRGLACGIAIAVTGLVAGCVTQDEASFSARNAQVEIDLRSYVRGQSNELLELTERLLSTSQKSKTSSRKMGRTLDETITLMNQIHMNLPSLLAAQDVEIADLRQQVTNGALDKATLKTRTNDIATYRKALLRSLNASAARAGSTVQALNGLGRDDLMQLSGIAQDLSRDLEAVRTMIEMQL